MSRIVYLISILSLILMSAPVDALEITPTQKGLEIQTDVFKNITLNYPVLETSGKQKVKPDGDVKINGPKTTVSYTDGTVLIISQNGGRFSFQFKDLPANVKSMNFGMNLPASIVNTLQWDIDNSGFKNFPAKVQDDPFLHKGNARNFSIAKDGIGFNMRIEHGYQQLQDNRKWNDTKFYWFAATQMPRTNGNNSYYNIEFKTADGITLEGTVTQQAETNVEPKPIEAHGVKTKLTSKGIAIDLNSGGIFTLTYPKLMGLKPDKPVSVDNVTSTLTHLKYVDGISAVVKLDQNENVKVDFDNLNDQVKTARLEMLIPIGMAKGGKFSIGNESLKPFPSEKQAKPFLYQGNNESLTLTHQTGPGFKLTMPKYGYQQLQDNRHWNWNIFAWWYGVTIPSGQSKFTLDFKIGDLPGGAVKAKPVVDRFGQWVASDYPTKVKSIEELKQDAIDDEAYYGSLTPPTRDSFGGIPGTKEKYNLKATGFFHLEKINGRDILVTPDGNAYFQLGVCGWTPCDDYTRVRGREEIYEWLPTEHDPEFKSAWRPNDPGVFSYLLANRIRKTGKPFDIYDYADMWLTREMKWGFNSLGAFCPTGEKFREVLGKHNYPFVNHLPMRSFKEILGIHLVWDPFEKGIEKKFDEVFSKFGQTYNNDPLLIGSFLVNEPNMENIPKVIPLLKASDCAAKAKLVEMLKEQYPTVSDFSKAWNIKASSFDEVGQLPLNITTKQASEDMQKYLGLFLDRRYKLVHDAFRKHVPNHLLIGDRWMPGTSNNERLVSTAGKYMDIISVNYYTDGIDRNYLDRIHRWSGGKPMILSEFYFTSPDESGLQGGRGLPSQDKRGLAYRSYVEQAMNTGYVVGIEWFINVDQTVTGRFFQGFNGEANNTGLVNVADRPYKDMLKHVMVTNYDWFSVIDGSRKAYILDDPRFTLQKGGSKKTVTIDRMVKAFKLDANRSEWPLTPPYRIAEAGAKVEGSFRVAWDTQNLYLFIEVTDEFPMINFQNGSGIWNGDAVELFIGYEDLDRVGNMIYSDRQVILRGAPAKDGQNNAWLANAPSQKTIDSIVVPNIDGKGYTIEARIPFASLDMTPKVNQTLLFDIALDSTNNVRSPRSEQVLFNGTKHASRDRGVWGHAKLVN